MYGLVAAHCGASLMFCPVLCLIVVFTLCLNVVFTRSCLPWRSPYLESGSWLLSSPRKHAYIILTPLNPTFI